MNTTAIRSKRIAILAIMALFAHLVMLGPATAGDHEMNSNLNDIADQLSRWSKQSSTAKMTPEAQKALSELLAEASRIIKEMAGEGGGNMEMEHKAKIKMMEKTWDPFDTSSGM